MEKILWTGENFYPLPAWLSVPAPFRSLCPQERFMRQPPHRNFQIFLRSPPHRNFQISQTQKPFCSPGATRLSRHYLIMQNLKLNPGHLMDHFLPPASKNKIL
ncbi:tat domain protein [Burkholderia pseudomallei MSHR7498]|nr:tat domain protein [Burkholderia pseudomallei]KGS70343.1 tat domain protein [Burkholderia pseudomallei MSHR7527]KGS92381.1 tat domain protein [Burkholderia pseudomallei MSHR7498]KGX50817.1 tat domain protein [Burkholderia pseudomallei TSV5]KGX51555.1 tat domain protein [Burkholderia pseudomallei TSV32]KGX52994.1 tat domain protein [Burkholderia pseudomallei TSV44]